jgi:hypothetical protein
MESSAAAAADSTGRSRPPHRLLETPSPRVRLNWESPNAAWAIIRNSTLTSISQDGIGSHICDRPAENGGRLLLAHLTDLTVHARRFMLVACHCVDRGTRDDRLQHRIDKIPRMVVARTLDFRPMEFFEAGEDGCAEVRTPRPQRAALQQFARTAGTGGHTRPRLAASGP